MQSKFSLGLKVKNLFNETQIAVSESFDAYYLQLLGHAQQTASVESGFLFSCAGTINSTHKGVELVFKKFLQNADLAFG